MNNSQFKNDDLLVLFDDQFNLETLKKLFAKQEEKSNGILSKIRDVTSPANEQIENSADVKLIVDLSDEQKQAYKEGTLKLEVGKNNEMYAQIKENGKYGKKLSIKEDLENANIAEADFKFAAELNAIKDQLAEIIEAMGEMQEYLVDILQGLHNDRVGLFYSGLTTYLEASQMLETPLRNALVSQAIQSINTSESQIIQEFKYNLFYLLNREYNKEKGKRQKRIQEKTESLHECFFLIYRATLLKTIIYMDLQQLPSLLMTFEELAHFIELFVKPNAAFLVECDPREDKLINTIWGKRSSAFEQCAEIKKYLNHRNTYYITMEGK